MPEQVAAAAAPSARLLLLARLRAAAASLGACSIGKWPPPEEYASDRLLATGVEPSKPKMAGDVICHTTLLR